MFPLEFTEKTLQRNFNISVSVLDTIFGHK